MAASQTTAGKFLDLLRNRQSAGFATSVLVLVMGYRIAMAYIETIAPDLGRGADALERAVDLENSRVSATDALRERVKLLEDRFAAHAETDGHQTLVERVNNHVQEHPR